MTPVRPLGTKITLPPGERLPEKATHPAGTVWVCPKCDWKYVAPIAMSDASHRCGKGVTAKVVVLRPRR